MGKKTQLKLFIRSIILIVSTIIMMYDVNLFKSIMNIEIIGSIKLHFIFWICLMYEMVVVMIPMFNNESYSGKLYKKHYKEVKNYDFAQLNVFTKENDKRAIRSAIFWIVLNICIGYLYIKFEIDEIYMYWLFLFFYWSDMFCINVWCPFHKIITKNKCCNECRIYNWGHLMYLTPLIHIKSIYTYSLITIGVFIFVQWEYLNKKYPERFSSVSNESLRCSTCNNACRYNPRKSLKKVNIT